MLLQLYPAVSPIFNLQIVSEFPFWVEFVPRSHFFLNHSHTWIKGVDMEWSSAVKSAYFGNELHERAMLSDKMGMVRLMKEL